MSATRPDATAPAAQKPIAIRTSAPPPEHKDMDGVDIFLHWPDRDAEALAARMRAATTDNRLRLQMIASRGVKVWPEGLPETFCTDHWRCRFLAVEAGGADRSLVVELLHRLDQAGIDWVKTEGLYRFDGEPGYLLGQGQ